MSFKILGSRKTFLAVYLVEFVKWLYQGLNSPHRVEIQALTPRYPLFHFVPYRLKTWLYSNGNLKTKIIIQGLFGICSFHNFIFTIELCLNIIRKFYVFLIQLSWSRRTFVYKDKSAKSWSTRTIFFSQKVVYKDIQFSKIFLLDQLNCTMIWYS